MSEAVTIPQPPKTKRDILRWFGPGFIFAATAIGSGELILTTRTASLYGWGFFWCVPIIIICKAVGTSLMLRYGTVTGRNFLKDIWEQKYLKWVIPYFMISSLLYLTGVGAHIGVASGALNLLLPGILPSQYWIAVVALIVAGVALSGTYRFLEKTMITLALIISVGIIVVAIAIAPPINEMLLGLIPQLPQDAPGDTALTTLIGLFGWLGAGWGPTLSYVWWAEEKGMGMHSTKKTFSQAKLNPQNITRLRKWLRIVHLDLSLSYMLTYVVSTCLYIAGATVLFQNNLHPQGLLLVETLSTLFTETIGSGAYYLFLISAFAILISSVIGVVEGLSHALRECTFLIWPTVKEKVKPQLIITVFSILTLVIPVVFLLFAERPVWLLLVSSMMFAPAIGIIFLISAFLCLKLPQPLRPHPLLIAISVGTAVTMITTSFWNILS